MYNPKRPTSIAVGNAASLQTGEMHSSAQDKQKYHKSFAVKWEHCR